MLCKFCGRKEELVHFDLFMGDVCKDCKKIIEKSFKMYDVAFLIFKSYLDKYDLNETFLSALEDVHNSCIIVHFAGYKVDKKLKDKLYIQLNCINGYEEIIVIEIRVSEYYKKPVIEFTVKAEEWSVVSRINSKLQIVSKRNYYSKNSLKELGETEKIFNLIRENFPEEDE